MKDKKCNHNWHLIESYTSMSFKPIGTVYTFICDKCGEFKELKRSKKKRVIVE